VVDVLVILDGASEPLRGGEPTSLELARTPALDRLAREGEATRLRTIAAGLSPGSETAIPALLGWMPPGAVDRGALEAAAYGIEVPEDGRAWRVDVLPDRAPSSDAPQPGHPCRDAVARAASGLRVAAPRNEVHVLRGHRLLLVGPAPLPAAALVRDARAWPDGLVPPEALARDLRAWPEGIVPPRILGPETVLVGARGAAIGAARLMGAGTIVPVGATGLPASDLAAKATAAISAIEEGAERVVVHVGGPDEAAHARDRAAKVAAIEHADRDVVGPLALAVLHAGGTLTVCPDHGCDPATGEHDAAPVPCVTWTRADPTLRRELHRMLARRRLTERAVAHLGETGLRAAPAGAAA
jgi:hypothetical protein